MTHRMNDRPKRDWQKTRIHFVCGVIFGGLSAFGSDGGWIVIAIIALVTGMLAAVFLDQFWDGIGSIWNRFY